MKKIITLLMFFVCLKANAQCSIVDQTVTATQNIFCPAGGSAMIKTGSSEIGLNYYLRNDADNSIVAGPVAGTGTILSLNTGFISVTTTYNVFAENASTPSCNLQMTQTTTVNIEDVTAPTADIVSLADAIGECSLTISTSPSATDNCAGVITGTTTDPLTYNSQGSYVIHWTYDDGNGNTSTQTQNVKVKDVTAPVADVTTLVDATGECLVKVTTPPTATDACTGTITGTTTDPLIYNSQGSYMIHWTYNDGNGNTSTQIQNVTVQDATAPVADVSTLPDIIAQCSVTISSVPTATDACMGIITGTTTDQLTYTTQGSYTITWVYDDGNGNISTQLQKVKIQDTTKPVADVSALPDLTGVCSVTATAPTATDNCAGSITGTTLNALTYNTVGPHVIIWTYDDGNSNTSTQTQNIIVSAVDTSLSLTGATFTANTAGAATYKWIDCNSNSVISGETSSSFTATTPGSYALEVTENGCTDRSGCYSIISTGVAKTIKYTVAIYPNPTSGAVTIDLHTLVTGKIIVRDIVGRLIISQEIQTQQIIVDLSDQANGMFFISIETPFSDQVVKVIKN